MIVIDSSLCGSDCGGLAGSASVQWFCSDFLPLHVQMMVFGFIYTATATLKSDLENNRLEKK